MGLLQQHDARAVDDALVLQRPGGVWTGSGELAARQVYGAGNPVMTARPSTCSKLAENVHARKRHARACGTFSSDNRSLSTGHAEPMMFSKQSESNLDISPCLNNM